MRTFILFASFLNAIIAFKYMGTNQAGAEFGSNLPGVYMVDYTFPTTTSIDYFVNNGMNIFRVPFLWERLQPSLNGDFDSSYFAGLDKTVKYITGTKGVNIILDAHNYGRYQNTPIGQGIDYSAFANLWSRLAGIYKSNPKVLFGLMNEPHDMPYANVFTAMQAGVSAIRSAGATGTILVPGNDWTGAHSWTDGSSAAMVAINDPLDNIMFEMHQYFDNNYSGNGACVNSFDPEAIFGPATAWLRSTGNVAFLGEFGIEKTVNCLSVLDKTMVYLAANSDVWQGWTWWAAGPWWGSYKYSLESGAGDSQFAVLKKYMNSASPSASSTSGSNQPSTTGSNLPSTTGSAPTIAPAAAPRPSGTTGRVKAASTTGSNQPSTTGAAGGSTVPPGTTSNCTSGNMKCLSNGVYATCNRGVWGAAQNCLSGTYCSPQGQYIYCLKGSAPASSTSSSSTSSTSSTSSSSTSTSGSALPSSTSSNASPVPVTPAPAAPVPVTPASGTCSMGQLRCAGTTQYQTCGNGPNGGFVWSVAQSCQAGLSCHAYGDQIYCY